MRPEPGQVLHYGWVQALRSVRLYAYRLPGDRFRPFSPTDPYAMVSEEPVDPLGPAEPVGDLLRCHEEAGIQLRVLPNLWPFWDAVITSTLGFSGIRLGNALPAGEPWHRFSGYVSGAFSGR